MAVCVLVSAVRGAIYLLTLLLKDAGITHTSIYLHTFVVQQISPCTFQLQLPSFNHKHTPYFNLLDITNATSSHRIGVYERCASWT